MAIPIQPESSIVNVARRFGLRRVTPLNCEQSLSDVLRAIQSDEINHADSLTVVGSMATEDYTAVTIKAFPAQGKFASSHIVIRSYCPLRKGAAQFTMLFPSSGIMLVSSGQLVANPTTVKHGSLPVKVFMYAFIPEKSSVTEFSTGQTFECNDPAPKAIQAAAIDPDVTITKADIDGHKHDAGHYHHSIDKIACRKRPAPQFDSQSFANAFRDLQLHEQQGIPEMIADVGGIIDGNNKLQSARFFAAKSGSNGIIAYSYFPLAPGNGSMVMFMQYAGVVNWAYGEIKSIEGIKGKLPIGTRYASAFIPIMAEVAIPMPTKDSILTYARYGLISSDGQSIPGTRPRFLECFQQCHR